MERERILIVEDDDTLLELYSEALNAVGYEVATHDSAFGAAARVREFAPSAVLLDLGLPFRPGTSLLTELKADPRTAAVPVLIVSGLPEALSEERQAQAAAVLAKPFQLDTLIDAITLVCARGRDN
jgi:DNA-binding response OmpR family regulator